MRRARGELRRNQAVLYQRLLECLDEDVEQGTGQRQRERVLLGADGRELLVVEGHANLTAVRQLSEARELVDAEQVAVTVLEHMFDDAVEVQRSDDRSQVCPRLLKAGVR